METLFAELLGFLIALIFGSLVFWFLGRFAPRPPNMLGSLIGAGIIEGATAFMNLLGFPMFFVLIGAFSVALITIIKITETSTAQGFMSTMLYFAAQLAVGAVVLMYAFSNPALSPF